VVLLFTSNDVWISPGQWGSAVWFVALLSFFAILVLHAARRSDMALFFLGSHAALLLARAYWLGDPLAIPLHQLQSGSLLIFAFFMISDPAPRPTRGSALPVRRLGCDPRALSRFLHADAAGATYIRADRDLPHSPFSSTASCRAERFAWGQAGQPGSLPMNLSSRLKTAVAVLAVLAAIAGPAAASAASTWPRPIPIVQQVVEGRAGRLRPATPPRSPWQATTKASQGVRGRHSGADLHRAQADRRRRR